MKGKSEVVIAICSFVVLAAFFLPWVSINSPVAGFVSKVTSGKNDASFMKISGFRVPILANRADSRFTVEIIQLFNPGIKDADKKSWLIWIVPLLAVGIAAGFRFLHMNKWFNGAVFIIGLAIFAVGTVKLLTTDLNKLVMSVTISSGLWITLIGYLGIGLVSGLQLIKSIKK
jgi:hypothetical protein